jgi:hypothetical protein
MFHDTCSYDSPLCFIVTYTVLLPFFLLGKWFATSYVHSLLIDFDIIVSIAKSDVFENFPVHTHGGFAIGFRVHYMSLENALHMTMLRQCMPNPSSSQ